MPALSSERNAKADRIEQLIQSQAWTDAALALIELELPQWQLRRLVYDDGEWYCALSRQREMPDWLDQSVESHHADLARAILMPSPRPSESVRRRIGLHAGRAIGHPDVRADLQRNFA